MMSGSAVQWALSSPQTLTLKHGDTSSLRIPVPQSPAAQGANRACRVAVQQLTDARLLGHNMVASGASALLPIFVLPKRGEPPARAGKLASCTYDDFDDFQDAVVAEVQKKPFASRYEPIQLAGGFFFVVKGVNVGAGERPGRPIGNGIVAGSVTLEGRLRAAGYLQL